MQLDATAIRPYVWIECRDQARGQGVTASEQGKQGNRQGNPQGNPQANPQADPQAGAERKAEAEPATETGGAQTPQAAAAQPAQTAAGLSAAGDAHAAERVESAAMLEEAHPEGPPPPPRDRMKPVRIWLWLVAVMVFAMVIVGGATRLTESGLSITEWRPVTGVMPPLNQADWQAQFEKYKQIPQFKEMFSGMTLAQYKVIFYWEWGHRLLGRLIGVVFILPFLFFLFTGRLRGGLAWKLLGVLALGAIQGGIGWWMVKSGLAGRTEVAAERLAIHLLLASLTFMALIWIALGLRGKSAEFAPRDVRAEASGLVWAVFVQIGLGALVAGSRAGLTYNTWPLMDGHLVPSLDKLTSMSPLWLNFLENPTMLQFQHRMFAYLVVLLMFGHALKTLQAEVGASAVRRAWSLVALAVGQAALGVLTLLYVLPAGKMPLHLALAHQAVAFVLLAMAVAHRRVMGSDQDVRTGSAAALAAQTYRVSPAQNDETAIAT